MKRCGKCGKEKEGKEFRRKRGRPDGLQAWCRDCMAAYHREAWRNPRHPAHVAKRASSDDANRRAQDPFDPMYWTKREAGWRQLGIQKHDGSPFTRAEFWEFWFEQNGTCAMCHRLFGTEFEIAVRKAQVDHFHKRGKFGPARALLCGACNWTVGDLTFETGKVLLAYLSRFDPSRAPAHSPAHTPAHTHTPA